MESSQFTRITTQLRNAQALCSDGQQHANLESARTLLRHLDGRYGALIGHLEAGNEDAARRAFAALIPRPSVVVASYVVDVP